MDFSKMNWKTSLAGIGAILVALGVALQANFDNNPDTVVNWEVCITAVLAGVGLILARDGDKTSKQVGAGK